MADGRLKMGVELREATTNKQGEEEGGEVVTLHRNEASLT
jgi:hypothetical protein